MDERRPARDDLIPFAEGSPLLIGMPVDAADGEVLGTVAEDDADRFKVAAPLAPDYWLPKSLIAGMAPGGDLVLSVSGDALDAAKIHHPDEQ